MALKVLNLQSMADLSHGAVGVAVDKLIRQAIRDCIDRPGDDRARKLTVQIEFTPTAHIDGQSVTCEGAKAVAKASLKCPNYETGVLDLAVRENGAALFAPNSPENVAQATMFDDED